MSTPTADAHVALCREALTLLKRIAEAGEQRNELLSDLSIGLWVLHDAMGEIVRAIADVDGF